MLTLNCTGFEIIKQVSVDSNDKVSDIYMAGARLKYQISRDLQ
jgi:hypothetical protein